MHMFCVLLSLISFVHSMCEGEDSVKRISRKLCSLKQKGKFFSENKSTSDL